MKDTKFVIEKWGGSGSAKWGEGSTLADAIRNAGIRCELCDHRRDGEIRHGGMMWCHERSEHVDVNYFCARHSQLNED